MHSDLTGTLFFALYGERTIGYILVVVQDAWMFSQCYSTKFIVSWYKVVKPKTSFHRYSQKSQDDLYLNVASIHWVFTSINKG